MVALGVGYADAFQAFRDELFAEPGLVARRVRRAPFCGLAPQNLRRHLALLLAFAVAELLERVLERGAVVEQLLVLTIGSHLGQGGHGLWSLGSLRASPTRSGGAAKTVGRLWAAVREDGAAVRRAQRTTQAPTAAGKFPTTLL